METHTAFNRLSLVKDAGKDQIAICVRNLFKRYKLYKDPVRGPLFEQLFFWRREQYYKDFLAIEDVSFDVAKGEVVGLVGINGAGKTTLLKIVAGLLLADAGTVEVRGNVTALMALGLAVHPEFSGWETILYNGLLMHLSKQELVARRAEIIDFAELNQEIIDSPLRTYSEGMKARLLFATATSIRPDILIIDEALSTGDVRFASKCIARIKELCQGGATMLFVSHNLHQVKDLCDRCLFIENGRVTFDGAASLAEHRYLTTSSRPGARLRGDRAEAERMPGEHCLPLGATGNSSYATPLNLGTGEIQVTDAYLTVGGRRVNVVEIGSDCEIHIEFEIAADDRVGFFLEFRTDKTQVTYGFLPMYPLPFPTCKGQNHLAIEVPRITLAAGLYSCDLSLYPDFPGYKFSYETSYCSYRSLLRFKVSVPNGQDTPWATLTELPIRSIDVISCASVGAVA